MNELSRMAYLEALGVDSYVSRRQLPGAAVTRRLVIVPTRMASAAKEGSGASVMRPVVTTPQTSPPPEAAIRPDVAASVSAELTIAAPAPELMHSAEPAPRFSLCTIVAGDWLWLEELGDLPLATEQVQLVQSMASALRRSSGAGGESVMPAVAAKPDVAQFDWPMHTNRQLDLGEAAARASVAAFVSRRLEKHGCRGVVLLGQSTAKRVALSEIKTRAVQTASSADILARPALKRQVWQDLQSLLGES